jgi:molecular chaperone Hsp33
MLAVPRTGVQASPVTEPSPGDDTGTDNVLRAMTDDGAFRVITVRATDTVTETVRLQRARGRSARYLGELVTGAVLVRETMAPTHRVQGLLHTRQRRSRLVADSHPDGGTRGLLTLADDALSLEDGTLEMMRTLYTGELHRGLVAIPEGGGISQALMSYMAASEQVVSMITVASVLDGERVVAAGGYIVQLLPEVGRGPLAVMTERLRDFEDIDELLTRTDADTAPLLDELLYGMPFTRLERRPLRFQCRCSEVRVMSTLASLGREELADMMQEQVIEVGCDYCGKQYAITPQRLQGLLDES